MPYQIETHTVISIIILTSIGDSPAHSIATTNTNQSIWGGHESAAVDIVRMEDLAPVARAAAIQRVRNQFTTNVLIETLRGPYCARQKINESGIDVSLGVMLKPTRAVMKRAVGLAQSSKTRAVPVVRYFS